ncbi:hypothetical protein J6T66_06100 [bacterium]|nr:hypothetical protein [bacterium]
MYVRKANSKRNNESPLEIEENDHVEENSPQDNPVEETHIVEPATEQDDVQNDINKYAEAIEKQTGRIAYGNKNNKEITITIDDGNS